mmetsp:Transcript_1142/g.2007  ORF Transcript_1142/g.2007 Transcript_1142/m.2007 type:complete len:324 (-) Transcript_1142:180-1151(-)
MKTARRGCSDSDPGAVSVPSTPHTHTNFFDVSCFVLSTLLTLWPRRMEYAGTCSISANRDRLSPIAALFAGLAKLKHRCTSNSARAASCAATTASGDAVGEASWGSGSAGSPFTLFTAHRSRTLIPLYTGSSDSSITSRHASTTSSPVAPSNRIRCSSSPGAIVRLLSVRPTIGGPLSSSTRSAHASNGPSKKISSCRSSSSSVHVGSAATAAYHSSCCASVSEFNSASSTFTLPASPLVSRSSSSCTVALAPSGPPPPRPIGTLASPAELSSDDLAHTRTLGRVRLQPRNPTLSLPRTARGSTLSLLLEHMASGTEAFLVVQ